MILQRLEFSDMGIFGSLRSLENEPEIAKTLEHSYFIPGGGFIAKLPFGTYRCVRGMHQLSGGFPFETFEITGVPGHSGILFHRGNFNRDSEGCILLGTDIENSALTHSADAFLKFMSGLDGVISFDLEVI